MHPRIFLLCVWSLTCAAVAQQATPLTGPALLNRLEENAVNYEARLPSLACREHITSQVLRGGKVMRVTEVDDVVRVLRRSDIASGMEEVRLPLNAAGEPQEGQHMPGLPLLVDDALYAGQHFYTEAAKNLACNLWELDTSGSTLRLNYRRNPQPAADASCKHAGDGMEGTTLVDRATGQVIYERHSLPGAEAQQQHHATYAEMNFAPVMLGQETFWLPQRVYAEAGQGLRFTAIYRGCKRYTGSARVLDEPAP